MATISSTIQLVDKMSATLANIEGNVNKMKDALKGVEDQQSSLNGASFSGFLASAEEAGEKMSKIGAKMSAAITAPLVLLGKKMYGNAVDYEAAFAGMTKTVSGTAEQHERLAESAKQLSETTPMSYVDLMGVAQTGGNMGVAVDQMENFMQSYAQLQYATDQHISGENGAQNVASFLNVTEGGVSNIEQFGSAIVHLGNNFNATEDQIIAMGNRMAAAAHLAGASTPEILGMATAFTAVGINAEAGGSAASKLVKQMQLASEVGGQVENTLRNTEITLGKTDAGIPIYFDLDEMGIQSGLDFVNYLDGLKNSDKVNIADQLGITTEALQSMADSWLLMDQFAQVSGKTSDQFINDWGTNAVGAMSDFFTGLSQVGEDGTESILATLDKMGLTEIRESNLIASMASRPELFANAVQAATEAYIANTAMGEEFNRQMETQESQNAMLGNKLQNTMADFGDNLVKLLEPALQIVNDILDAFNSLSEVDQTNILKGIGIVAALGPALTIAGKAITVISKSMQLISGSGKGAADAVKSVVDAAGSSAASEAAQTATTTGATVAGAGTGSALLGVAGIGAIAAGFVWAANERQNNENIRGSVNAINQATQGNQELQNAFVEYIQANEAWENLVSAENTDFWNADVATQDQMATDATNRVEAATKALQAFENYQSVLDAYSAWRQENSFGNMDWILPENLLDLFGAGNAEQTVEVSVVPEVNELTPELPEIPEVPEQNIEIPVIPEITGFTPEALQALIDLGIDPNLLTGSGADVVNGLASGIEGNTAASDAASAMGADAVQAANDALGVNSPSTFMIAAGLNVDQGLMMGIQSGQAMVISAASAMGNQVVTITNRILSPAVASSIGLYFANGLANGIRAGASAVIAAAVAVANAGLNAANGALGIHSPSKETYWQGEMLIAGYVDAIKNGSDLVTRTVSNAVEGSESSWNSGLWDIISGFAEVEQQALQDEFNHVKDGIKLNDSDLKKIRTLAEREVINKITTPSFNVEFNPTIHSTEKGIDAEGVIKTLEDYVVERLEACSEGVYN